MKKAIRLSIFLGLVACISTIALAAVNYVTSPIIREFQDAAFRAAVELAFPEAGSFEVIATEEDVYSNYIVSVLQIFDNDGETIGYIYEKSVPGFGGAISYVMGIDIDGVFTSFNVLSHSETPGFGARIVTETEFEERLVNNYAGNPVDILTGATATTTPIIRAVGDLYQDFLTRR
ncbi:MAG: FMN-binding protein [Defluviitaleaceae bacterium]|nr:FMN-binding protein [Defluviitaleaceae bacterium]